MKTPPPALAERLVAVSEDVLRPDRDMRLEEVAALVGSKRATLYYYFSGRDDLIAFLLEEHLAAASDAMATAGSTEQPPDVRLRAALVALIGFLSQRPGVCSGLLSFAGSTGHMQAVMSAKDAMISAPVQAILEDGASAKVFSIGDASDAANAVLGAIMIATIGRWQRGEAATPTFQRDLANQIVRGVLTPPRPVKAQTRAAK